MDLDNKFSKIECCLTLIKIKLEIIEKEMGKC